MYTIEDVHHCNDLLIAELDRVCKEHGITYYLDSGTLIGAVRHKGNIPWDDDVDVAMTRDEYERFVQVCEDGGLSEGYEFVRPDDYGENHFFDFIPHIAYTKSRIKPEEGEMEFLNGKQNHLLLDIFILDEISGSVLAQSWKLLRLKLIYMLSWAHRYRLDYSEYSPAQRIVVAVMSSIGKLFRQSALNRLYDNISKSSRRRGYDKLFASNYPFEYLDCIFEKKWFDETLRVPFDEFEFDIPAGYDELLRTVYGDYMKLPDAASRCPGHYDVESEYFKIYD